MSKYAFYSDTQRSYPRVADAVAHITRARIAGKELAARRPTTLLRMFRNGYRLEVKPALGSSPTGWVVSGAAILTVGHQGKRGISARLHPDGRMSLKSWFKDMDKTMPQVNFLHAALDAASVDPLILLSSQEDSCGLCGRGLTDPISRTRGIGTECWKLFDRITEELAA